MFCCSSARLQFSCDTNADLLPDSCYEDGTKDPVLIPDKETAASCLSLGAEQVMMRLLARSLRRPQRRESCEASEQPEPAQRRFCRDDAHRQNRSSSS